jgi:hypothetical protein
MKRFVSIFCLAAACLRVGAIGSDEVDMVFGGLPVVQFAEFCAEFVDKRPIVVHPSVEGVKGSVRLRSGTMSAAKARALCADVVRSFGLAYVTRDGYVELRSVASEERVDWEQFIYKPRFRAVAELQDLARVVVSRGAFAGDRLIQTGTGGGVAETGSNGASLTSKGGDRLVFVGPREEVRALESLVRRLDSPRGQVVVRVGVVEFSRGATDGTALQVLGSLFGRRLALSSGVEAVAGGRLAVIFGSLEVALSMLDRDQRFRVVSRPDVVVLDGARASFAAVEDRRVAGTVVVDGKGNPVQSRESLSAGVQLDVGVAVRDGGAELELGQSVSQFAGVSGSDPVILRRSARTQLRAVFGEAVVIGGLVQERTEASESRLFGYRVGRGSDQESLEVFFLVQVVEA